MEESEREFWQQVAKLVPEEFHLPDTAEYWDFSALVAAITPRIRSMLDKDFRQFLQLCYRIDISESRLKKIFAEAPTDELAETLAKELIARQVQKQRLREKFRP